MSMMDIPVGDENVLEAKCYSLEEEYPIFSYGWLTESY